MENIFTKIADNQISKNFNSGFGKSDSLSGPGSDLMQTSNIIEKLPLILKKYNANNLFDVPCGDFYWMKHILKNNDFINYIGGDIVSKIIEINKSISSNKINNNIKFIQFDICKDKIPDNIDIIFIRDLFVHFSYEKIKESLNNIRKSNVKYIMMTTFINRKNTDLSNVFGWRPLSFFNPPFNFPKPKELLVELCSEDFPNNLDKCLGLWELKDINF